MIQLTDHGMYLVNGVPQETAATAQEEARRRTMAWQILQAHNVSPDPMQLRIRFDAMVSYQFDRNLTLQLNAYNLGDKVYYSGVRSPHYATIAAGRSAVASLKFTY